MFQTATDFRLHYNPQDREHTAAWQKLLAKALSDTGEPGKVRWGGFSATSPHCMLNLAGSPCRHQFHSLHYPGSPSEPAPPAVLNEAADVAKDCCESQQVLWKPDRWRLRGSNCNFSGNCKCGTSYSLGARLHMYRNELSVLGFSVLKAEEINKQKK